MNKIKSLLLTLLSSVLVYVVFFADVAAGFKNIGYFMLCVYLVITIIAMFAIDEDDIKSVANSAKGTFFGRFILHTTTITQILIFVYFSDNLLTLIALIYYFVMIVTIQKIKEVQDEN